MNIPDKIIQQLNITKEVTNVSIRSVGNNIGGNSPVSRIPLSKEIRTTLKKGESMIPSKGLFDDYNAIDKEEIPVAEKVWKYIPKLLKIILNCRTNTVKIMDKLGIERETKVVVAPVKEEPKE